MSSARRLFAAWLRSPSTRTAAPRLQLLGLEDRTTPADFSVTTVADSGAGSLRQALLDAAANAETDKITFSASISGQTVQLLTPLSVTEQNGVTVTGSITTLAGNDLTQLLTVAAGAKAIFEAVTFTKGKGADGGAVNNAGTLTLLNCVLKANEATGSGGAIYNSGTLTLSGSSTLSGCEVTNNKAGGNGGGLANVGAAAVMVVDRSAVGATTDGTTVTAGNTATGTGGGLFNGAGAKLTVVNSTLAKNTSAGGAGVENAGTALLTNVTVADNTGAGLNTATGGSSTSNNTLYLRNSAGEITGVNLATSKFNLLGSGTAAGGLTNGTDGNIVGVADLTTVFGSFVVDGGTSSYELKAGSPAIDKGSNALAVDAAGAPLTVDQTNFDKSRIKPANGTVDIGAREFVVVPPFSYGSDGQTISTDKNVSKLLTVLFIETTYTADTVVKLTVNDGKLSFSDPLPSGVTNVSGDKTGTLTFTATKGALAGGAGGGLTFTPTQDAVYAAADGKLLTITLTNGSNPVQTYTNKLEVTAPQVVSTPKPFNTATPAGTTRPLNIFLNQNPLASTQKLRVDSITGGKLYTDEATTAEVTSGSSVDTTFANGSPKPEVLLYFKPNAGFTGAGSFSLKAVDINGAFSPAVTDTVQVVAAGIPFVAGDNPGAYSSVGPRLANTPTYDFVVYYQDDKSVSSSKLGDGDVTVSSRKGSFSQAAKFLGASTNGTFTLATYRITAPGGSFNSAAEGSYLVSLAAGKAVDADGNSAPAQDLFTFDVNLTAPAAGIPTAKLAAPAVDATYQGKTDYTFTVTFTDDKALNVATVQGKNDLVSVLGPNGFVGAAEFVSLDQTTNGTPRVATYKLTAPGGDWDAADNGTYTVSLGYTVADSDGNLVPGGYLGSFTASGLTLPPVASFSVAGSSVDEGQTKDVVVTVTLDKPAPDNLFIQIGFSGTATLNDPATKPAVFDYTVNGFQLAPFTLQIAKGATSGTMSVKIFDDTLVEPTETAIFTIDPASAGITVGKQNSYTLSIIDNDGPAADTIAPTAKLGTVTAGTGGTYTFTVLYADNVAVAGSSLDSKDIRVTSPTGSFNQLATFVSASPTGNGPAVTATYKVTVPTTVTATYTIALEAGQVLDTAGNKAAAATFAPTFTFTLPPPPAPKSTLVGFKQYAVGTDKGSGAQVQFYNPDASARLVDPIAPFPGFTGGVRTAAADFNGDGVADIVVGTGPGVATRVLVYDGATQAVLFDVAPFEAAFTGGVYVAAGDLDGDGTPELVITPDEGGGPRVKVFNGKGFAQTSDFFGIEDVNFRGGARPAIGDVDGDGKGDLIVAAGFGGGPRIAGFSGAKLGADGGPKVFPDYFAFEQTLRNGTFVAVGDVDGDGKAEVIAGGGPGGGPRVIAFSAAGLLTGQANPLADFFAGDVNSRGGVRLAVKNLDDDTRADIVAGSGTGAGSKVTAYTGAAIAAAGTNPTPLSNIDAFSGFSGGVFVG